MLMTKDSAAMAVSLNTSIYSSLKNSFKKADSSALRRQDENLPELYKVNSQQHQGSKGNSSSEESSYPP